MLLSPTVPALPKFALNSLVFSAPSTAAFAAFSIAFNILSPFLADSVMLSAAGTSASIKVLSPTTAPLPKDLSPVS